MHKDIIHVYDVKQMQNWPKSQEVVFADRRHYRSLSLIVMNWGPTPPYWAGSQCPKIIIPPLMDSAEFRMTVWLTGKCRFGDEGTDDTAANRPQGWAQSLVTRSRTEMQVSTEPCPPHPPGVRSPVNTSKIALHKENANVRQPRENIVFLFRAQVNQNSQGKRT